MPRKANKKANIREVLLREGVLTGPRGQETARLTLDGVFVINIPEMYKWIVRELARRGKTSLATTVINPEWSLSGKRIDSAYVNNALEEMARLGVLKAQTDDEGIIYSVALAMIPAKALKILPRYYTRAEKLAGLEPVSNDDI